MIEYPLLPTGEKPIWDGTCFQLGDRSTHVLIYSTNLAGWNNKLTELHEIEAGDGQHPIDKASRKITIKALSRYGFPRGGKLLEIGCSSGFLLHDLRQIFPQAEIVGTDIIIPPLERLGESLQGVPLVQMDILQCSFSAQQFDAVVALNVLEHIDHDEKALMQMVRLLKPGGILVLEVPQGPELYDYFDAYLQHTRRYSKKELIAKLSAADLTIERLNCLGFISYLPFVMIKKLNRFRFGTHGEKLINIEKKVRQQIKTTHKSNLLDFAFFIDTALSEKWSLPWGIRFAVVARAC